MANGLLSDKLCMNELCDKIKNSKTQPATATQATLTIQIIATDECDVTITTD